MNAAAVPVLPAWAEWAVVALLVVAAAFALVGAYALARLPDFLTRLHGPSKATTLGVGCALLASALAFGVAGEGSLHELLITLFLFLTAPVSAHLLVQAVLARAPQHQRPPPPPGHAAAAATLAADPAATAAAAPTAAAATAAAADAGGSA